MSRAEINRTMQGNTLKQSLPYGGSEGVMIPNDLMGLDIPTRKKYEEFMKSKCGEVITYNINDMEDKKND